MKILVTGAGGFLGWHVRLRLSALTDHEVIPVYRSNWQDLPHLIKRADSVIHLAGVNRADRDDEVEEGNIQLAYDLSSAIKGAGRAIKVVFAGTIQTDRDNPYGRGKLAAQKLLEEATQDVSGSFVNVCLTNLFGEHGVPFYNSFVATFIHATIAGKKPAISGNSVELLHAQDAAQALIDALSARDGQVQPKGLVIGVREVWDMLQEFHEAYEHTGDIPSLHSKFRIDLFNSYRSALFPSHYPIRLLPHTDPRGSFVETVRCHGGQGQSSISTTETGVTRGEHYHLTKIERFAVIQGTAEISLRRKFTNDVVTFGVSGDSPVAIDMPVGWVHNITNTGDQLLITQFWSHELFRPESPDTFAEPVQLSEKEDQP
ncbi:NAD-dependent epimerase/dehydratase family protein [Dietzia sp. CH92]|uniref:polysaccharide biosynthesis C-terminal domain-containing protein n=1 Tax=Dietzia sp. CH92 TaxID=3051823 RepID=UPI0028D4868C|nr:NAD-dependent epimerase/dehydratase family protein [Dietzia sp. CH92]